MGTTYRWGHPVDPEPLARRVAEVLKEYGYSRIEDVEHRFF